MSLERLLLIEETRPFMPVKSDTHTRDLRCASFQVTDKQISFPSNTLFLCLCLQVYPICGTKKGRNREGKKEQLVASCFVTSQAVTFKTCLTI